MCLNPAAGPEPWSFLKPQCCVAATFPPPLLSASALRAQSGSNFCPIAGPEFCPSPCHVMLLLALRFHLFPSPAGSCRWPWTHSCAALLSEKQYKNAQNKNEKISKNGWHLALLLGWPGRLAGSQQYHPLHLWKLVGGLRAKQKFYTYNLLKKT